MKFSRLAVVTEAKDRNVDGLVRWECVCDCGRSTVVPGAWLVKGNTKSCGCLQRDAVRLTIQRNKTHGATDTAMYWKWRSMIRRCYDTRVQQYANYGGRGIGVCDRWRTSFECFVSDMGHPPRGVSIERINNDGDYAPGNCRWATQKDQCRNRRMTIFLELDGRPTPLTEVSEKTGIHRATLYWRFKQGWKPPKLLQISG